MTVNLQSSFPHVFEWNTDLCERDREVRAKINIRELNEKLVHEQKPVGE